jgi:hypothetical protein
MVKANCNRDRRSAEASIEVSYLLRLFSATGVPLRRQRCRREPLSDMEAREPCDPAGSRIAEKGFL